MTKQEEIREGMIKETDKWLPLDCPQRETRIINIVNSCWDYLHSQGVVISTNGFYSDLMEPLIKEPKQ